uniref:Uncharacterized protein n=1 Tax=Rousettus aegyptiacus TaxID=9407 RepID=A0A7J8EL44_ROUAE|nr:hypothetical protein HJG63_012510 [Rousettus aegyptiacus]
MSLNIEKDEGHLNQSAIPRKIQDELVYVIRMSLNNIGIQVNNLSKYAEDKFEKISKEVCRISFRLKILQKYVIQFTNGINYKEPNENLSLQIKKSRTVRSINIQTQQVYSSKPLPVKECKRHNDSVQTLPFNTSTSSCQDGTKGLKISPDVSYCFELCKEKIVPASKEENGGKLKQKKHKGHSNNEKVCLKVN